MFRPATGVHFEADDDDEAAKSDVEQGDGHDDVLSALQAVASSAPPRLTSGHDQPMTPTTRDIKQEKEAATIRSPIKSARKLPMFLYSASKGIPDRIAHLQFIKPPTIEPKAASAKPTVKIERVDDQAEANSTTTCIAPPEHPPRLEYLPDSQPPEVLSNDHSGESGDDGDHCEAQVRDTVITRNPFESNPQQCEVNPRLITKTMARPSLLSVLPSKSFKWTVVKEEDV